MCAKINQFLYSFLKSCFHIVFFQLPILLLTVCLFFTTSFNFLLSMSATTSLCFNSKELLSRLLNTFGCFYQSTKNYSQFYFYLYCIFFSSATPFQTMCLLHPIPFHRKTQATFFLNTLFAKSISTMYTFKIIIPSS